MFDYKIFREILRTKKFDGGTTANIIFDMLALRFGYKCFSMPNISDTLAMYVFGGTLVVCLYCIFLDRLFKVKKI